jgi:hypothetical protein
MDQFVFVPNARVPFSYTTSAALGLRTITPGLMPTDGGSVPRILRGLNKFSAWGYAPAFMIHDWIFHAKKRGIAPDGGISFEMSAAIMAEVIKTLMEAGYADFSGRPQRLPKAEDTLYLMHVAVSSSIARRLWDNNATAEDVVASGGGLTV